MTKIAKVAIGDSVAKVKEYYGITYEPTVFKTAIKPEITGGAAYQYHFPDYGVWVFFNVNLIVQSLRFDPPFGGKIGGIVPGDDMDEVLRIKGKSKREFEGFPDLAELNARDKHKRDILDALPDPAQKKDVLKAFDEITKINNAPIQHTLAWVYPLGETTFVRYDISQWAGKVQTILIWENTRKK